MKKFFRVKNILLAIIIGLTVAGVVLAFTGPTLAPTGGTPYFWQLSSGNMYYTGGNVGIGTANPGAKLHIDASSGGGALNIVTTVNPLTDLVSINENVASNNAAMRILTPTGGNADQNTGLNIQSRYTGANPLYIYDSNNNPLFTVKAGGNVGIATTTPSYPLTVSGDIYSTGYVRAATGLCMAGVCQTAWPSGSGSGTVTSVGSGAGLTGGPITTSGTLSINNTGSVQSCTNATTQKVIWNASGYFGCATDQNSGGTITGSGTSGYVAKFDAGQDITNSLIYDNGTNVGIGTASPSYTLQVAGSEYITNYLGVGVAPSASYPLYVSGIGYITSYIGVGTAPNAVNGITVATGGNGVWAQGTSNGVWGSGPSTGVSGQASGNGAGVVGYGAGSGAGVSGTGGATGNGVTGTGGSSSGYGVYGTGSTGVYGSGTSYGIYGNSSSGIGVYASSGYTGIMAYGGTGYGVGGQSTNSYGVYGTGPTGVYGSGSSYGVYGYSTNYAGYFSGNVYVTGNLTVAGTKSFIQPYPNDPTKEINYVSMEGADTKVFFDGEGQITNGVAVIQIPDDFKTVVSHQKPLIVTVTPNGNPASLYVADKNYDTITIKSNDTKDVAFDYFVTGFRGGFENSMPIQPNTHFVPASTSTKDINNFEQQFKLSNNDTHYSKVGKELDKNLLIQNGILNSDGTANMGVIDKVLNSK